MASEHIIKVRPEYFVPDIKFIAPYLHKLPETESTEPKEGSFVPWSIPLVRNEASLDLLRKLDLEKSEFKKRRTEHTALSGNTSKRLKQSVGEATSNDTEENDTVDHLEPLNQFSSISSSDVDQQILTLCVVNFPNFHNLATESILNKAVKPLLSEFHNRYSTSSVSYKWASSSPDTDEYKIVYVRFTYGKDNTGFINLNTDKEIKLAFVRDVLIRFLNIFEGMSLSRKVEEEFNRLRIRSETLRVCYDGNTKKLMDMAKENQTIESVEELRKTVKAFADDVSHHNLEKSTSSLNNADFKQYTVNLKELSDLPKKMIPQLEEDIRTFRTNIYEVERKKQARKLQEERRRAKLQIKKMLFPITKSEKSKDQASEDEDMESEDDGMTDLQYEEMLQNQIQERAEFEYKKALSRIKLEETNTYKMLLAKADSLKHYEEDIENSKKGSYLKDYELMFGDEDNEEEFANIAKLENNDLKALVNRYKRDKAAFAQTRLTAKLKEEALDKEDREQEKKEGDIPVQDDKNKEKGVFKLLLKKSKANDIPEDMKEEPPVQKSLSIDEAKFYSRSSEEIAKAVAESERFMFSLFEEFLGVEEVELANFIMSSVKEKKPVSEIVQELENVLDDEAEVFMERYWRKLEEC